MKSEIYKNKKIAWISILQAIAISAIVAGHIDLEGDMNPEFALASWCDTFSQFSLPVFSLFLGIYM